MIFPIFQLRLHFTSQVDKIRSDFIRSIFRTAGPVQLPFQIKRLSRMIACPEPDLIDVIMDTLERPSEGITLMGTDKTCILISSTIDTRPFNKDP